ncbi:hypothetical protein PAL_GLEAN10014687 [Pteropus alecto]|uniref:Uncharacterized protein n=1 Tax=Pteropus alecto TaxID=9402 RepID=L5KNC2_PTEAL|nr:hypothetical protein PAL_GLEAN10014687 [Pteropus alecto]
MVLLQWAEVGGPASVEGTLRCKVIALALGHRAPDFPTRRDFQAMLWCGVGLKVMYVDPLRWGNPPGSEALWALH